MRFEQSLRHPLEGAIGFEALPPVVGLSIAKASITGDLAKIGTGEQAVRCDGGVKGTGNFVVPIGDRQRMAIFFQALSSGC